VIVDWAWITAHWDSTDFAALNRFIELLTARGVPVAAMYRPRFLREPTVPIQVDRAGKPVTSQGFYICFSSAEARQWGASWGTRILQKCPQIREIIIYNPLNQCQCPACREAAQQSPFAHYDAVWRFLAEAKAAWQAQRPAVKLGVVFVSDPEFWRRGAEALDVAHPFLFVQENTDMAQDMAAASALRKLLPGKVGPCLAKITWGPNDKVLPARLAQFDQLAAAAGLPYFFWTFDTLFTSDLYDPGAVAQALGLESQTIQSAVSGVRRTPSVSTGPPGSLTYAPEEIRRTPAEVFLARMLQPEPGYWQFAAMNALAEKAKQADPAERDRILTLATGVMQDRRRPLYQRWQCCYVLSGSGDERTLPYLIQVLLRDESETMRAVAAEAVGAFPNNLQARDALRQASRQESSLPVRQALARQLGKATPPPLAPPTPGPAPPADEHAPAGPPQPPPGPKLPASKPLPWPFPGGQREQNIFNNYQQATDSYIHCGLDFIHPAGTPVTAVDSGYVAAIFTNYPGWRTHYCFILTPTKGGRAGWCYTHLDPSTFTFHAGDFVRQGQRLGSLVDFSVGNQPGAAHLHLDYVRFSRDGASKVAVHSLIDPFYFFDCTDTEPPVFQPLRLVRDGTNVLFPAGADGKVTVRGRVDVLAAIADSTYPGQVGGLGVPVVMFSISDGTHTLQKLVLDHRADVGDERQVQPLYLSHDERKFYFNPDSFPRYQMLRVTKTDGDGRITPRDAAECWNTTARDAMGRPLWPDGQYWVNVYAWDLAGNRAATGVVVRVKNNP
jgi:murein DD-endopeptidase MepM/ murein hydrolase activator NlpD